LGFGVFARRPRALSGLIAAALVGVYLGRDALDQHDLGVTCRNFG
jgi:hypothetical protein